MQFVRNQLIMWSVIVARAIHSPARLWVGNSAFDGGGMLAKVFRQYDDDHSGSITPLEMSMMVP